MKFFRFEICWPGLVALTLLLAGCNTDQAATSSAPPLAGDWTEFSSPASRFTMLFPGTTKATQSSTATENGPVEVFQFRHTNLKRGKIAICDAGYHDNPPGVVPPIAVNTFLDIVWKENWSKIPGHTVQWKRETLVEGFPAIEFQMTNAKGNMTTTMQMIQVKDRTYQLSIILPTKHQNSGDAEKFLQSFRLTQ